jgi:hypothetical protein
MIDALSQNWIIFLTTATSLAFLSAISCRALSGRWLTAATGFWGSWTILIWAGEIVTTFDVTPQYANYEISPATRVLILQTFIAAAAGFLIGSISRPAARADVRDRNVPSLRSLRIQWLVSLQIAIVGFIEFIINFLSFSNLRDLRYAAVTGDVTTPFFFTQYFYFAYAFLIYLAAVHAREGKIQRWTVLAAAAGMILHGLATGARIAIVIVPALYLIAYAFQAQRLGKLSFGRPVEYWRALRQSLAAVILLFFVIGLLRANPNVAAPGGVLLIKNALLALPLYISDTIISISVHTEFAKRADIPLGYFTFDSFYRLFGPVLGLAEVDGNYVFGHIYFRNTPDPWAWTQTNMIPRLVADFGENYWIAVLVISVISQRITLSRFDSTLVDVAVRSLIFLSSVQSVLLVGWLSAFNVNILFYIFVIIAVVKTKKRRMRKYQNISK